LLTVVQSAMAAEWPVFRGPDSDNVVRDTTGLSDVDGLGLAPAWQHALGPGYSGVSVASGRAVTQFSDGENDLVVAFDAATGAELWRYPTSPTYRGHDGSHDGPISTVLIAGGRVFALSPWGDFHAIDLESGRKSWATHLVEDHGSMPPLFGYGSSPVFFDGVVVLEAGAGGGPPGTGLPRGRGPAVLGLDPASGDVLWRVGEESVNYQSPMVATVGDRRLVVATTDVHLYGLEAKTGAVLWKFAHGGELYPGPGTASMNPVPLGGGRFLLTDSPNSSKVVALTPGEDGRMALKEVWSGRSIRGSYATPVYYEGHVYAYSSNFLTCVDATSGQTVWRSRQPGDGFPILVDGHLVVMTKNGSLHVAEASPEGYREVASRTLFASSWTPPSFADGRIYVRGLDGIAAVDLAAGASPAAGRESSDGTRFARFLGEVMAASDKAKAVDRFLSAHESFPVIEDDGEEVAVHFLYRGAAQDMAIAGDFIGDRAEEAMSRLSGTDLFYYSARLLPDARVSYYFIKDFEERLTDPMNPRKAPDLMGEVSWVGMPRWVAPTHLGEAPQERRGRIEDLEVAGRQVRVYTPAGYQAAAPRRYPVAYVHGGRAALGLGGWTRTLDNLVGTSVEPLIAVFIPASQPEELAFEPGLSPYVDLFAESIVPAIDSQYRTLARAESRASVGAGMAGYAAVYSAFKHPGVVGRVASQSTFLLTMQTLLLAELVKTAGEQPLAIFLEWGTYDSRARHEAWDIREENRNLVEILERRGYEVTASEVPDGHGWASWSQRNDQVLEWLFPLVR
jgi:enterochelin esterase-like enzyme/outer membrane protein assembly factor BamB